jgi:hypothetical protein
VDEQQVVEEVVVAFVKLVEVHRRPRVAMSPLGDPPASIGSTPDRPVGGGPSGKDAE